MGQFDFNYGSPATQQSPTSNIGVAPSPVNTGGNTSHPQPQPGQIDWQKFFSNPIFANFFKQYQQQQQMPGVSPLVGYNMSPQALSLFQLLGGNNFGRMG